MPSDLLFYEASDGYAEFYGTSDGTIALRRAQTGWGANWTHIAAGVFGTVGGLTQIILYNAVTGTIRMDLVTDVPGSVGPDVLVKEIPNWRPGWSQVVMGNFTASQGGNGQWIPGFAQLLFYDATQGIGEIYGFLEGTPGLINRFTNWRKTWKQIVPGNFNGGAVTDLLFYDASAGTGEFYAVSQDAGISLMRTMTGWRTSWNLIVPGKFSGNTLSDLLFYDANAGVGEFYAVKNADIQLLRSNSGWRKNWNQILAANFTGKSFNDLLFYDAEEATGQFYTTDNGSIGLINTYTDWRKTWTQVLASTFTGPPPITTSNPQPFVTASIQPFDDGSSYKMLLIEGNNFQANETVELSITVQTGSDKPVPLTASTAANSLGSFAYTYSGAGGGVCDEQSATVIRFTAQGTGQASHKVSNVATASCL